MRGAPGVIVRISIREAARGTHLLVAGDLVAEAVPEFEAQCARAVPPLVLDLSQLDRVDVKGLEALARVSRSASIESASPYIALRLERHLSGRRPDREGKA